MRNTSARRWQSSEDVTEVIRSARKDSSVMQAAHCACQSPMKIGMVLAR